MKSAIARFMLFSLSIHRTAMMVHYLSPEVNNNRLVLAFREKEYL
jgi:hypothetical protein